jgi:hypothetical protein
MIDVTSFMTQAIDTNLRLRRGRERDKRGDGKVNEKCCSL